MNNIVYTVGERIVDRIGLTMFKQYLGFGKSQNINRIWDRRKLGKDSGRGTVKSDIFALGLVFVYLILKGHHLYGSYEIAIINNIVANKQINIKSKIST